MSDARKARSGDRLEPSLQHLLNGRPHRVPPRPIPSRQRIVRLIRRIERLRNLSSWQRCESTDRSPNRMGTFARTVLYLAPELFKRPRSYIKAVDIWSLGIIATAAVKR